MADNTVRIMLKMGETTIEVEGPESYVDNKLQKPDSFDSLIEKITGAAQFVSSKMKAKVKTAVVREGKPKKPSKKEGYNIIKDLVLIGEGDTPSLEEFYSQKKPKTNYERNVVFCYYLLKIKGIERIRVDHIYTCYKEVGQKWGNLSVSLSETSSIKGWLDTTDMSNIKLSDRGEKYVEFNLPKVKKAK